MKVRPGAVIRGAGVGLACLSTGASKRSPIILAGFVGGWFLNKPGLRVFSILPDLNEPWKRTTVPFATSVTSWSTVMLVATTAVRRTGLPDPIAAVALGGGLVVIDSLLADRGEAREAREANAAAKLQRARDAGEAAKAAEADAPEVAADPTR
jgi:hypothetical protein